MRIFYDLEFNEQVDPMDFISIGMVDESGAELYRINNDPRVIDRALSNSFLRHNVLDKLPISINNDNTWNWDINHPDVPYVYHIAAISSDVRRFVLSRTSPELWAYYGAYDHVIMCRSLFGTMIQLPQGFPQYTNDLMTIIQYHNRPLPEQPSGAHNALDDARFNVVRAKALGMMK